MARQLLAQQRRGERAQFCEAFRRLTGLEVESAVPNALPARFLDRAVPTPRDLLDRHGAGLRVLTINVLRRHTAGIVEDGAWTYRRLLAIRGFGVGCLLDVLRALAGADGRAESEALAIPGDGRP